MTVYKMPLRLEPQAEGRFTVTSPAVQGLMAEGDTMAEAPRHEVQVIEVDYPVVRA
jgi:hypothetical protein